MDDLDAIDRLFALKQKGAITDEEFTREKGKILSAGVNQPRAAVAALSELSSIEQRSGYATSGSSKILTALLLAAVAIGGAWFFLRPSQPPAAEEVALRDYLVGTWVGYSTEVAEADRCATDFYLEFSKDGTYEDVNGDEIEKGKWSAEGDAVTYGSRRNKITARVERKSDSRASFVYIDDKKSAPWNAVRCAPSK